LNAKKHFILGRNDISKQALPINLQAKVIRMTGDMSNWFLRL
jgi:hypothetical protein